LDRMQTMLLCFTCTLFKRLVDDVKYVAVKKKYQGCINISFTESPCIRKPTRDSSETENVDAINNNHCHCSLQTVRNSSKGGYDADCVHPGRPSDYNATEPLTARVLSMASDARSGKTGAVFAIVAIKSPAYELQHEEKGIRSLKTLAGDAEPAPPATAKRTVKVKAPAKDSDGVPLGPVEHEWLVKAATGSWRQIYGLLLQDPRLAEKPNFMSGFTILHWAAKSRNGEMVCKVIDVSRQRGAGVDVNAKSYDGYTALHIAAIYSHERVLSLLVCEYGANTNIRDNSGKKPYRYLSPDVSIEIRKMLGDPHSLQKDAQNLSDLPKGFNTLSKPFQPHTAGHKKKYRRRPSFHFIRDDHEDRRKNVALNRKLLQ
uniref:Sosondowah ankyrin repeat domain family member Ab n=1 Tax=Sinocyclocheilus anshuiensis TaxID=1608454 RepID=A0A671NG01_9TELE